MPKKKITSDFLWAQWQQNKITLDEYFAFIDDGTIPAIFATPDVAHQMTDEMLAKLEKQIRREYDQAAKEMGRKYREYMRAFRDEEAQLKELVKAGEMSKADFKAWRVRHMAMGEQFTQMRDVLAADMEHANEIALGISRGQMPEVFAINANFAQYQIAHDFQLDAAFTLYDHNTAAYLLSEQRQMMPGPSTALQKKIAADKALKWNQKKIQSAVLQGVLQGEGSEEIAKRLQGVAQMNYNSAVRYARTMTTNAQNAGRYEGYHKAKDLGIDLTIEWQAVLDAHTRHTHRMMHGQRREVDEPFEVDGIKILYPAQSSGPGASTIPQSMIWNCRCTLLAWVKGFEGETVKHSPGMGNMSFEEWQGVKKEATAVATQVTVATVPQNIFRNVKGIDEDFQKGMTEVLEKCQNEDAKALYRHYADQLECKESDLKKGAFFRRPDGGVHMNVANVAKGNGYETPYETAFHEFGHMIDWLGNGGGRWNTVYASNLEYDGKRLLDVIKSDFRAFKKTCGVTKAADVIPVLKAERMGLRECGNISDILEKCTGVSYPLGLGHGVDYHRKEGATEKEFFAEVLDSAVANEAGYKQMVRLFPNAVEMVWDIVRGLVK